jgi:hypothetical protein
MEVSGLPPCMHVEVKSAFSKIVLFSFADPKLQLKKITGPYCTHKIIKQGNPDISVVSYRSISHGSTSYRQGCHRGIRITPLEEC